MPVQYMYTHITSYCIEHHTYSHSSNASLVFGQTWFVWGAYLWCSALCYHRLLSKLCPLFKAPNQNIVYGQRCHLEAEKATLMKCDELTLYRQSRTSLNKRHNSRDFRWKYQCLFYNIAVIVFIIRMKSNLYQPHRITNGSKLTD